VALPTCLASHLEHLSGQAKRVVRELLESVPISRYSDWNGDKRLMRLALAEFLRRFFLHALPRGFVRIRHFGFLAQ
jgi:hypothetical protein